MGGPGGIVWTAAAITASVAQVAPAPATAQTRHDGRLCPSNQITKPRNRRTTERTNHQAATSATPQQSERTARRTATTLRTVDIPAAAAATVWSTAANTADIASPSVPGAAGAQEPIPSTPCAGSYVTVADGHTVSNAPDLFRPPKVSGTGPGQYWGGDRPGSP